MLLDYRTMKSIGHLWSLCSLVVLVQLPVCGDEWSHWRGTNRNGLVAESSCWEEGGWSKWNETWRRNVGEGATSPLVVGQSVFVMGWAAGRDRVLCLDLRSGKEQWRQEYPAPRYGRHAEGDQGLYAGTTSTPEFDAATGLLLTLSCDGDLRAWNTRDGGRPIWKRQLYDEFDVPKRPRVGRSGRRDYGFTSSPLALGQWVIVEVGATTGNLVAFDLRSGETRWQSQNTSPAGHNGGPVPLNVQQVPCVAVLTFDGLHVARLDRGQEGKTVATHPWRTDFANNIATLTVAGDSVLLTSHYNQQRTARLRVSLGGAEVVWEAPLASQVCSPVVLGDHVYFAWEQVHCLDFSTGKARWRGGRTGDPGSCIGTGDGRLIVWCGQGKLLLVESAARSPDAFTVLAEREVLSQTDAWPHVALAGGNLLCKDRAGNLVCLTLGAASSP
jgi:outer membrane protein assembly factor BamB